MDTRDAKTTAETAAHTAPVDHMVFTKEPLEGHRFLRVSMDSFLIASPAALMSAPIASRHESGPVEGVRADALRAPKAQHGEACLADGIG